MRAIAICGPTSAGKSSLAAEIARTLGGEIVNADSRQVYRGMRIGTGWPSPELMALAPHHGYGIIEPMERYSAARFVADATRAIAGIAARGRLPLVVGGSGFYLEALAGSMPLDRAVADDELRERVRREAGLHPQEVLHAWLRALAPQEAVRVGEGDRYRTLRALESALVRRGENAAPPLPRHATVRLRIILLEAERTALHERIRSRIETMFAAGLVAEAVAIAQRYGDAPALSGIGFAEALAFHRGAATHGEAVARTIARTRRYAKRQQTWFRHMRSDAIVRVTDQCAALSAVVSLARETTERT